MSSEQQSELDGLVRFLRKGIEGLAGGTGEATPTFGVLAFALEDWIYDTCTKGEFIPLRAGRITYLWTSSSLFQNPSASNHSGVESGPLWSDGLSFLLRDVDIHDIQCA